MALVDLPLLDQVLVPLLAVLPGAVLPGSHRALIHPEGSNNGLQRAAMTQQRQHDRHQVGGVLQAEEGRAGGGGKGAPTGGAAIAPFLLAMHPDVPLADLPPGRAVGVRAE